MIIVKTHIAPDQYGGRGLFASEPIQKGDVVWRFTDDTTRIISVDEYKAMCVADDELARTLKTYCYPGEIEWMGKMQRVLFHDLDNGSFMNHNESPNTGVITDPAHPLFDDPDGVNIALRDIQMGEEMTYNYFDFVDDLSQWQDVETCMQFLIDSGLTPKKKTA